MKSARDRALPVVGSACLLASCATAPSLTVVGSYFPAWLACGILGILAAIAARAIFIAMGLGDALPFQLFVFTAIGIVAASLIWLVWVG